jgi:hypothetical protein
MYLLRVILVFLIIFLIVRAFIIARSSKERINKKSDPDNIKGDPPKSVPKDIGEYIDYEDVDKST